MKNYRILSLLFCVLLVLTQCSKEKRLEKKLCKNGGRWKMIEKEMVWYNYSKEIDSITVKQVEQTIIFIFKKDGTMECNIQYSNGSTNSGTYQYDVISDNKLILKTDGHEIPYIILECTNNRLKIEEEFISEAYVDLPGATNYIKKYKERLIFTKI